MNLFLPVVDVNWKTLHVVQKPPPNAPWSSTANIAGERPQPNTRSSSGGAHLHGHRPSTGVLSSHTVPSETVESSQVQVGYMPPIVIILQQFFSSVCDNPHLHTKNCKIQ